MTHPGTLNQKILRMSLKIDMLDTRVIRKKKVINERVPREKINQANLF